MSKVLIIGPSWLGDMIMSQALFKALHKQNKIIDVLAPKWNHAILKCMPEVNKAIELPFDHGEIKLYARYKFAQSLRQEQYDECIVIPNSFKSALIPYWAKISIRTGWLGEFRYLLLNNYQKLKPAVLPLMVQRLAALAYFDKNFNQENFVKFDNNKILYPKLYSNPKIVDNTFEKYKLTSQKLNAKILILAPGAAFGEAKKWPEEHFAEVAREKIKQGWHIILLGSPKDKLSADKVAEQIANSNQCSNLAGLLQLPETVAIISQAQAIVSNDSGLLHVAAGLSTPLIGIYGSTSPGFTPPLISDDKKAILEINKSQLSCRPCFQKTCQFGHLRCLRDIKPQLVINILDKLDKSGKLCES
ncbi:MAG: lipopolysaccharide heptosyltransferase II [Gammaproteobacteria bacterium]|nr:lipopolysaccharide heptosyltransferase II [Gammaproteobacteria bacterium]